MTATVNKNKLILSQNFKPFHLKRLTKLRDVFASATKIPGGYKMELGNSKVLFEMDFFAQSIVKAIEEHDVAPIAAKHCGTAACVIGTAGIIPEFRKAGLKTHAKADIVEHCNPKTHDFISADSMAFDTFFGADCEYYVCMPDQYCDTRSKEVKVTPKDVVNRLNVLITKGEKVLKKGKV